MKWLKIDPDNLPKGEVLAACFDPASDHIGIKMIGILISVGTVVKCFQKIAEGDLQILATHYIYIHKHDDERE